MTELLEAEADVLRRLPVQAHISRVWLMAGRAAPGSWQTIAELPWLQDDRQLKRTQSGISGRGAGEAVPI